MVEYDLELAQYMDVMDVIFDVLSLGRCPRCTYVLDGG